MQNCYKSGKVPRGESAEQDERLTTKHIQTLSFLQEIVNENKELKAKIANLEVEFCKCKELHELAENAQERIKKIQQEYLDRADEMRQTLTDKYNEEIMKRVEEKVEAEQKFLNEKEELQKIIDRLLKENKDLNAQFGQQKELDDELMNLQKENGSLKLEIEKLNKNQGILQQENSNQLLEIQRLQCVEDRNERLVDELSEANQRIKELEFRLARQERDAGAVGAAEQEDLMTAIRVKLQNLHKEKAIWGEKETVYQNTQEDLKAEVSKLRKALADSERMRGEMHEQLDELIRELNLLRNRQSSMSDSQTFKEFIKVKRELAMVKEENEELRTRLKGKKGVVLPKMLEGGDANGKLVSSPQNKKDVLMLKSK